MITRLEIEEPALDGKGLPNVHSALSEEDDISYFELMVSDSSSEPVWFEYLETIDTWAKMRRRVLGLLIDALRFY